MLQNIGTRATHERLSRSARPFAPVAAEQRVLASPADRRPIAITLANQRIREGSHGDTMHKLIHVKSGHLDIEGCLGGWLVLPGHMILVPAERAFNIVSNGRCGLEVVHLEPSATPWTHHGCWVSHSPLLAREMIAHAVHLSDTLRTNSSTTSAQKFSAYMAALSLLCSDWFTNPRMLFMPAAQSGETSALLSYLRDHIASATVEHAAEHLQLPQRSLHRRCMQEFGMNLRSLIREIRIVLSMELLAAGTMSVSAVSHAVGFSSLSAFTSAFSARFDLTPRQYLARVNMRA